jgi:predicted lipoprotein with Yx(FWY)xxD motif
MTRRKPLAFITGALALSAVALTVAACGDSNNDSSSTPATVSPKTASGHSATVGVATTSSLGKVLDNSQGRTVYLFAPDTSTKSACTGACAAEWPPLRATGKPTVGSGLSASEVGTIPRSDGRPQVTYNGHPLYTFVGDKDAGQTNGQGINAFGGGWFALTTAGTQVSGNAAPSSGGTTY